MLFIIGEQTVTRILDEKTFRCPVCSRNQPYQRFVETSFFTLFSIRLLPLRNLADYYQCSSCGNAFDPSQLDEPSHLKGVRRVLAYILVGFDKSDHRDSVQEIFQKLCNRPYKPEEIDREISVIEKGKEDVFSSLKGTAYRINIRGKQQIIEAAFLMTHACCEIQHEDRLRINLIGSALGVSLEFVAAVIDRVRSESYYGIRRNLIVQ
jgi:hypothetical protein|tara:strand:- start:485 stop:1108 length:624 start_codon:yes stop_codon:yes gene_type:complete